MSDTENVTCSLCGTTAAAPAPLTWSASSGPRGLTYACDTCTRAHVRAMEAKLEQEYW